MSQFFQGHLLNNPSVTQWFEMFYHIKNLPIYISLFLSTSFNPFSLFAYSCIKKKKKKPSKNSTMTFYYVLIFDDQIYPLLKVNSVISGILFSLNIFNKINIFNPIEIEIKINFGRFDMFIVLNYIIPRVWTISFHTHHLLCFLFNISHESLV